MFCFQENQVGQLNHISGLEEFCDLASNKSFLMPVGEEDPFNLEFNGHEDDAISELHCPK
jgi:hypothetical protein